MTSSFHFAHYTYTRQWHFNRITQDRWSPLLTQLPTVMRCSLGVNVQEKNRARLVLKALCFLPGLHWQFQISETKIALIILLSIFGFIDQPYKSKTYPTQPSKKNTCQRHLFSLTAIMFRWWNMIAGQVTSNDWGSRIKLGREVKCLVFVLCFLQTVFLDCTECCCFCMLLFGQSLLLLTGWHSFWLDFWGS